MRATMRSLCFRLTKSPIWRSMTFSNRSSLSTADGSDRCFSSGNFPSPAALYLRSFQNLLADMAPSLAQSVTSSKTKFGCPWRHHAKRRREAGNEALSESSSVSHTCHCLALSAMKHVTAAAKFQHISCISLHSHAYCRVLALRSLSRTSPKLWGIIYVTDH